MIWKCLICEKDMTPNDPMDRGDDSTATLPNIAGGTMEIDFGYGSWFDDGNGFLRGQYIRHQACICDDCYQKKMHLTRAIEVKTQNRFVVLPSGYRDWS